MFSPFLSYSAGLIYPISLPVSCLQSLYIGFTMCRRLPRKTTQRATLNALLKNALQLLLLLFFDDVVVVIIVVVAACLLSAKIPRNSAKIASASGIRRRRRRRICLPMIYLQNEIKISFRPRKSQK